MGREEATSRATAREVDSVSGEVGSSDMGDSSTTVMGPEDTVEKVIASGMSCIDDAAATSVFGTEGTLSCTRTAGALRSSTEATGDSGRGIPAAKEVSSRTPLERSFNDAAGDTCAEAGSGVSAGDGVSSG